AAGAAAGAAAAAGVVVSAFGVSDFAHARSAIADSDNSWKRMKVSRDEGGGVDNEDADLRSSPQRCSASSAKRLLRPLLRRGARTRIQDNHRPIRRAVVGGPHALAARDVLYLPVRHVA